MISARPARFRVLRRQAPNNHNQIQQRSSFAVVQLRCCSDESGALARAAAEVLPAGFAGLVLSGGAGSSCLGLPGYFRWFDPHNRNLAVTVADGMLTNDVTSRDKNSFNQTWCSPFATSLIGIGNSFDHPRLACGISCIQIRGPSF